MDPRPELGARAHMDVAAVLGREVLFRRRSHRAPKIQRPRRIKPKMPRAQTISTRQSWEGSSRSSSAFSAERFAPSIRAASKLLTRLRLEIVGGNGV